MNNDQNRINLVLMDGKGRSIYVTDTNDSTILDLDGKYHHVHTILEARIAVAMQELEKAALPLTDEEIAGAAYESIETIQSASNLSGVALSFGKGVIAVRHAEGLDTTHTNTHPLVKLYLHQLVFLATGIEILDDQQYSDAMAWCRAKASAYREQATKEVGHAESATCEGQ
jgi:hypothetical protein